MADFEIEKPIVGSVLSIEDTIQLEIDLVATNSASWERVLDHSDRRGWIDRLLTRM